MIYRASAGDTGRIDEILATIRLQGQRDQLAGSLSHGQKQWLEIGMLLAQDPKLLLVDEPVAGMTDAKKRSLQLACQMTWSLSIPCPLNVASQ